MNSEFRRLRFALYALFFLPGIAFASWITRTPTIRDMLDVSVGEMGIVLFGMSVGAMTGVLLSGFAISRFGARLVTGVGLSSVILALFVLSLGVTVADKYVAMLGLSLFGLGMGLLEIAINLEGAALERASGVTFMHILHGCFSLGTLTGALVGLGLTFWNVPLQAHLLVVAVLAVGPVVMFVSRLPAATGKRDASSDASSGGMQAALKVVNLRLILIGLIVLAVALAEGAATDWLPILMVDEYGVSLSAASLVYLVFAASVTAGRFGGDPVLKRLGREGVIRYGIALAIVGMAVVIFGNQTWMAIGGVIAWGLGVSMSFPLAISAAAQGDGNSDLRVKLVAIMGYCAFLAGPPVLGLAGEHLGLRSAMLLVAAVAFIGLLSAKAARSPN